MNARAEREESEESEWAKETEYFSIEENEEYFYYKEGCCGGEECAIY